MRGEGQGQDGRVMLLSDKVAAFEFVHVERRH